jgi:hypothetical protein
MMQPFKINIEKRRKSKEGIFLKAKEKKRLTKILLNGIIK